MGARKSTVGLHFVDAAVLPVQCSSRYRIRVTSCLSAYTSIRLSRVDLLARLDDRKDLEKLK